MQEHIKRDGRMAEDGKARCPICRQDASLPRLYDLRRLMPPPPELDGAGGGGGHGAEDEAEAVRARL
eukprot:1093136-Prymnesium_polylepis.1